MPLLLAGAPPAPPPDWTTRLVLRTAPTLAIALPLAVGLARERAQAWLAPWPGSLRAEGRALLPPALPLIAAATLTAEHVARSGLPIPTPVIDLGLGRLPEAALAVGLALVLLRVNLANQGRCRPGEAIQTDFTSSNKLGITILGKPFEHLLCNSAGGRRIPAAGQDAGDPRRRQAAREGPAASSRGVRLSRPRRVPGDRRQRGRATVEPVKFKKPAQPAPHERAPPPGEGPSEAQPERTAAELGVVVDRLGREARCALCHDTVLMAHAGAACPACATVLHRDCARGVASCPTLGCGQRTRAYRPLTAVPTLAERTRVGPGVFRGAAAAVAVAAALGLASAGVSEVAAWRERRAQERAAAQAAADADRRLRDRCAELVAALSAPVEEERRQAAESLGELDTALAAAPLAKACVREPGNVRYAALWSLVRISDVRPGVDVLAKALSSATDATFRARAVYALGELRGRAAPAVEALRAALRSDADEEVRQLAAEALWKIDRVAAVPALLAALGDGSARVRQRCLALLGEVDLARDAENAGALVGCLEHADVEVRLLAVRALVRLRGSGAAGVEGALAKARDDPDPRVRRIAAEPPSTRAR